jgi:hypothetical protein
MLGALLDGAPGVVDAPDPLRSHPSSHTAISARREGGDNEPEQRDKGRSGEG